MRNILIDLLKAEPEISQTQAAQRLGVSRQRISQLCKELGLKMKRGVRPWKPPLLGTGLNHFGYERQRRNPSFIGGASELTVAADLLRRGIPVYRSLTHVGAFDLIADYDGTLVRVEVRSAKRKPDGRLIFVRPEPRYDVLALVTQEAEIIYRPIDGCKWPF